MIFVKIISFILFCLISNFSFASEYLNEQIEKELSLIDSKLKIIGLEISQIIKIEDKNMDNNLESSEEDKKKLLELSINFNKMLDYEIKVDDNRVNILAGLSLSGIAGLLSYFSNSSFLLNLKGSYCMFSTCKEGFYKFIEYSSNKMFCVPGEVAYLCLQQIKSLGVSNIEDYAVYSKDCFPLISSELVGQKIEFGTVELIENSLCKIAFDVMSNAPCIILVVLLGGVCIKLLYDNKLISDNIEKAHQLINKCDDDFFERLKNSFEANKLTIDFIKHLYKNGNSIKCFTI